MLLVITKADLLVMVAVTSIHKLAHNVKMEEAPTFALLETTRRVLPVPEKRIRIPKSVNSAITEEARTLVTEASTKLESLVTARTSTILKHAPFAETAVFLILVLLETSKMGPSALVT